MTATYPHEYWMDAAACAGHPNPDIWYPDSKDLFSRNTREAQLICASCPVKAECLRYGMNEPYGGIYGGVLLNAGKAARPNLPPVPDGMSAAWTRPAPKPVPERTIIKLKPSTVVPKPRPVQPPAPKAIPAPAAVEKPVEAQPAPVEHVTPPVSEPVRAVEPAPLKAVEPAKKAKPVRVPPVALPEPELIIPDSLLDLADRVEAAMGAAPVRVAPEDRMVPPIPRIARTLTRTGS